MGLTIKDKIEQFKRDCKSNEYYTKSIIECNEKIEEYDVILTGLGSHNSGDPKCENARNPYASNKLAPLMKQDAIIKERDEYIEKINKVNSTLMKIVNPVDRQMIIDLYVNRKYYKDVMNEYHYADHSAMYKHINNVLAKIV